jgi:hypothetical protein
MQQLNSELAALKRQIATEIVRIVDGMEREAKVAALREDAVKQRLDELSARAVATGGDEVKLKELESLARTKRQQLESLRATFEAARSRTEAQAVPLEAQILQQARPSSLPSFPKKAPMALLTFAAFMLLGLVSVIAREALPDRRMDERRGPAASSLPAGGPRLDPGLRAGPALGGLASIDGLRTSKLSLGEQFFDGFGKVTSVAQVAKHLIHRAPATGGHRCLILPTRDDVRFSEDAIKLAQTIADTGRAVVLVYFCHRDRVTPASTGIDTMPGLSELIDGTVSFEAVVQRLPGGNAHAIAGGRGFAGPDTGYVLDIDRINMVLDALDEAYDHIVVTGDRTAGLHLFEAVQGRFDAAIMVSDPSQRPAATDAGPSRFLGFEVAEIDIISYERSARASTVPRTLRLAATDSAA